MKKVEIWKNRFFFGVIRVYLFLLNGKFFNVYWGVYVGCDKSIIFMLLK